MPPDPRGACPAIGELKVKCVNNDLELNYVGESAPDDDMESPRNVIEHDAGGVAPRSSENNTNAANVNVSDDFRPLTFNNH